jgi:hypothetical protein
VEQSSAAPKRSSKRQSKSNYKRRSIPFWKSPILQPEMCYS